MRESRTSGSGGREVEQSPPLPDTRRSASRPAGEVGVGTDKQPGSLSIQPSYGFGHAVARTSAGSRPPGRLSMYIATIYTLEDEPHR